MSKQGIMVYGLKGILFARFDVSVPITETDMFNFNGSAVDCAIEIMKQGMKKND